MSQHEGRDTTSGFVLTLPVATTLLTTVGLILLAFVFLYAETYNMTPSFLQGYPGDAFFPRVILIFSMIWVAIILVRGILLKHPAAAMGYDSPTISVHWVEFTSVCVLVLLYALLLEPLGFEITTVVLMTVLLIPRLLAAPGAKAAQAALQALALAVASMLTLYLVLGPFLKIALPLQFLPIFLY